MSNAVRFLVLAATVAAAVAPSVVRAGEEPSSNRKPGAPPLAVTARAISDDARVAAAAIAELRAAGPAGLAALLAAHAEALPMSLATRGKEPAARRLLDAIDAVAAQKDATASRLYWHTDLAGAVAAAKAEGRPILSLRMLGRLDEDCSCANSRFFRTVLYANAEVSKALRERFVLHWKSVRPVPKVTVDFGDGRRIERTVTGNSAHLVLDAEGRPVDVVPGLYGPAAFLRAIDAAAAIARETATLSGSARDEALTRAHAARLESLDAAMAADAAKLPASPSSPLTAYAFPAPAPSAAEAGRLAFAKEAVETSVLAALARATSFSAETEAATWRAVAALHADDARLDPSSIALVRAKRADLAEGAMRLAESKVRVEDPVFRLVRSFERSLAEDTVRNEYLRHRQVHAWFTEGTSAPEADALTERVYADLFLMPKDDPWLGLAPADAYSALDGDGLVVPGR